MRRAALVVLVASSTVLACAHESATAPADDPAAPIATVTSATALQSTAPIEDAPAAREDGRLPKLATPSHYAIALDVDPTQPRFHGTVSIDVDVAHPTSHIVLHAHDLNVTDVGATFGSKAIGGTSTSRVAHGGLEPEELVLIFPEPLPAGRATITLSYDAPFAADLQGLYRVKEGERWYAFTQFESTDARRAFPCFDEPAYKATYDVTIRAPKGMLAVANTPERAHQDDAGAVRYEFATTPPLSSYLVAFAVGDFDVREGAKDPVPVRLITVKGKAALGDFALDATAGLVKKLGEYFALPYPFPKLDIMAVPDFRAGAMENPGLVTFREEMLLQDSKHSSLRMQREAAVTIGHELAHMWFGDLVTMEWWNDVWLNEGFATWMETRVTDAWRPEYAFHTEAVADAQDVMDTDALASARAVRQPVTTTGEIEEAFDGISYQKGAAVLAMIEHTIGEAAFQRGVRDYIRAHAWKNATADDLLGALDRASGRDVTAMAATFLDRPGVPVVAVTSSCNAGKTSFELTQSAWRPTGAQPPSDTAAWRVPVCVHEASGKDECVDMNGEHAVLESKATCGTWAFPNASEAGYYRFSLSEHDARALAHQASQLDAPSRIGLVSNLWAQVRAGGLSADVLLDVLPSFDHETDGYVVKQVIDTLTEIDHALVDDASRPAFRSYVAARMAAQKKRLGWQGKPGEDDGSTEVRPDVLALLGNVARDPATLREADVLAKRWLADPSSVDADVAPVAVRLASIDGDGARWEQLRVAAKSAKTPLDRIVALGGLGTFEDPKLLERTFDLLLTDDVKMQDFGYVVGGRRNTATLRHTAASRVFFAWLNAHWEAARAKLPGPLAERYAAVLRGACSVEERDAELSFLQPHMADVEGSTRPLAEEAERVTTCAALRAESAPAVSRFFGAKPPHKG
jgi:alanyl aminopeptidase